MRPSSRQLALRDSALAAQLGILAANGSNFGSEFSGEFGEDGFGEDFGEEFEGEDDFGADPVVAKPTAAQALAAFKSQQMARINQQKRTNLLNPNRGSNIKVERYAFTISQALVIGAPLALALGGQPDTTIRPQVLTMNAPTPMFATITEIKVANVSVTIGTGQEDAFNYSPLAVLKQLDLPTLTPANRATILGNYTGYVPPGFAVGLAVTFSATFKGPASVVA